LVLVGNRKEPFHRLLDAVRAIAPRLPQPVVVQHGNTPFADASCETHAFLDRDRCWAQIELAELVICHAGAGCVIETLRTGKVPLVMPRKKEFGEVIDDHQSEFAAALTETGKAIVVATPAELMAGAERALTSGRLNKVNVAEIPLVAMVRDALRLAAAASEAKARQT
jgi:UDP-N-acetylglucosamine transferase subunit ALG13